MVRYLVVILLSSTLMARDGIAQTILESLHTRLRDGLPDTARIDTLNELGREYLTIDLKQSAFYASEALAAALQYNYPRGAGAAYRVLSSIHSRNDNFAASTEYIQKALDYYTRAGDTAGIGNCHITIGNALLRQGDFNKSLHYHRLAVATFQKLRQPERLGVSFSNLAESFIQAGKLDSAEWAAHQAITHLDSLRDRKVIVSCYTALGTVEVKRGNLRSAEVHLIRSLRLNQLLGERSQKTALLNTLVGLAEIAGQQGDHKLQLAWLRDAERVAIQFEYRRELPTLYLKQIQANASLGQAVPIERLTQLAMAAQDSLTRRNAPNRSEAYEELLRVKEIEAQNQELLLQRELDAQTIKVQNYQIAFTCTGLSFFLFLLFLFWVDVRKKQKVNLRLHEQRLALTRQNRQLQELNATKDKFFSIVSHDLRSPINAMISYATLITQSIDKMSKDEIHQLGVRLKASLSNATKMAENLITWSKLQMQMVQRVPVPVGVHELVAEAISHVEAQARQKDICIVNETDCDLRITADRDQVLFVFRNLLNNSLKFSFPGSQVVVKSSRDSTLATITVQDRGVGMSAETLRKIFEVSGMHTTQGTSGEVGTGLGLILCKEFVEKNSGEIGVESIPGQGTTFLISLPINSTVLTDSAVR